ncbi:MAG: GNAT family N-acetyltransferase, partial [Gammaproteobacteria bacterium]
MHPAHQGRCAGRRLLAHAESETRKRGCASLQLYTHECMTENVAIYKRAGYFETGRRTERGYKRVYMRKS